MAAYARKLITLEGEVASYLLTNKCVRGAFLCGEDRASGRNYSHRKKWLEDRIKYVINNCFFIDLLSYSILCNHFHTTVTTRQDIAALAPDEEIIQRWWKLFPRKIKGIHPEEPPAELKEKWLNDKKWIEARRARLCSISWFMAQVSEPIARRANKESGEPGRFWQGRFDSRILIGGASILNATTYVDLNPIRAGLCKDLATSEFTSIKSRIEQLQNSKEIPDDFLNAFTSQFAQLETYSPSLCIDVRDYVEICAYKASEFLGREKGNCGQIFLEAMSKLSLSDDTLNWKRIRQCKFALGNHDSLVDFAKRRGVKKPYYTRK
jgi:hypothetical protein